MPLTSLLVTSLSCATAAFALSSWARRIARGESRWLRSWLPTLLAALGGAGVALAARSYAELLAFALLVPACALLVVIDLAECRLPDIIIAPMYPILFAALTLAALLSGEWARLGRAALAAAVLLAGYLALALITPSGLGLGDVKLSGLLGAFLGWLGWPQVLVGTLAAFLLNAAVAVVLLAARRVHRNSDIPFGPWLVAGAAVGAAVGAAAFTAG